MTKQSILTILHLPTADERNVLEQAPVQQIINRHCRIVYVLLLAIIGILLVLAHINRTTPIALALVFIIPVLLIATFFHIHQEWAYLSLRNAIQDAIVMVGPGQTHDGKVKDGWLDILAQRCKIKGTINGYPKYHIEYTEYCIVDIGLTDNGQFPHRKRFLYVLCKSGGYVFIQNERGIDIRKAHSRIIM